MSDRKKKDSRYGEPCNKCATPLIVREGQTYCPSCNTFY